MMNKKWFKLFIWFMATFFFFLASAVLISTFSPGPTESSAMRFMEGMMGAMDQSLMGISMGIEGDTALQSIITLSTALFVPIVVFSVFVGSAIRALRRSKKNV